MDFKKGREVSFDTAHSNHVYAPQCSECLKDTYPGDPCIEFGHEAGFVGVKCNHIATVLDSKNIMHYLFTTPDDHDAWHAALDAVQPETPEQFMSLVWAYFKLDAWEPTS
jgi:hypothetical protein